MTRLQVGGILVLVGGIAVLVGLFVRTSPSSAPSGDTPAVSPTADSAGTAPALAPSYNLGDVDYATVATVRLSDRSKSPSIQYHEQAGLRGDVLLANATVSAPYPPSLWLWATIESPRGYQAKDTVLVRMSLTVDTRKDPLVTKTYLFSGKNLASTPERIELDLMPFIQPVPSTVLVMSKLQIVWFPNTDPATIDPGTVDLSKGQSLDRLSNPLRINFN